MELTGKCKECAKASKPIVHGKCNFCQDLGFREMIFCDLNRCVQDLASFRCHAFQPVLKLVEPSKQDVLTLPKNSWEQSQKDKFQKLLDSERIQYQRALALQKITREPDEVFMEVKYHFVWNVIYRKPIFEQTENMFDFISDIFANCSERIGGSSNLLWLAPDHIHLYVETDGEKSPETIAQEMKRISATPILAELAGLKVTRNAEKNLWDKTYFVETIG